MVAVWIILKLVHETAHGAVCRYYGGDVPRAGVALIVFMPIAYVDVSSCWRFDSRWKRLHVTLAGVLAELGIAGLGMLVWAWSNSEFVRQASADLVLMASVTSLLFNLNPLLKFDGYFALSDLTNVNNLYQHGQQYARYFGLRFILGLSLSTQSCRIRKSWWIKIYGVLASCWRVITVFGLLAAAAALLDGAGIALAFVGGCMFFVMPIAKLVSYLKRGVEFGEIAVTTLALRLTTLACAIVSLLLFLPAELRPDDSRNRRVQSPIDSACTYCGFRRPNFR